MRSPFFVTVGQIYDGPFDLLLDLIRKQNLDIRDIPIRRITAQFLDYTRRLKEADVDAAGEFVYTASLLIHIKSQTLLPRDPLLATGQGIFEDPRQRLVDQLLEHERFKAAAEMLRQKQEFEDASWTNPGFGDRSIPKQKTGGEEGNEADTVDLVRMFQDALALLKERTVLQVEEDALTVGLMKAYLKRTLSALENPVSMATLLEPPATDHMTVPLFLAILDLVRLQAVLVHQPHPQGDILVKKAPAFEEWSDVTKHGADDWG